VNRKIITPADITGPRMVTLKELWDKLYPYVAGWAWGEDAIVDLWNLGAPDPQHSMCPQVIEHSGPPCPTRQCPHVKRLLIPKQFAKWWQEVQQRQATALAVEQALARQNKPGTNGHGQ